MINFLSAKPAKLSFLIIALLMAGCSTVKIPQATGGSRSDAVVNMSYEYGVFEKPVIDWNQTRMEAQKRCQAWGYANAEAFGGAKSECTSRDTYGSCLNQTITHAYQCTK